MPQVVERIRVEGLKAVANALHRDLPRATARNVMRRVLRKRAQPIKQAMISRVQEFKGYLKLSITISSKLSKRQRAKFRKEHRDQVDVFIGPGPYPYAHMLEFGTEDTRPYPFVRPAWQANKHAVLEGIKDDLWAEIRKAVERRARRAVKKR